MFFVPLFGSLLIGFTAKSTARSLFPEPRKIPVERQTAKETTSVNPKSDSQIVVKNNGEQTFNIDFGDDGVNVSEPIEPKNMGDSIKKTVQEALTQILMLPFQIFIASFSSIVVALLYMKTRQVGGESMQDLLEQFEESEKPRSNWQKRVKARLEQSGKQTSRS